MDASGEASMAMDRKDFFKTGLSETAKSLYNTKIGGIVDRQLQSFANLLAPFAEPADAPAEKSSSESGKAIEGASTSARASGTADAPAQAPANRSETAPTAPAPPRKKRGFARPPGSVRDPERFKQICTECGDCIIACPYGAILRAPGVYGPVMNPNLVACALCEDYPCIEACDERALLPIPEGFLPKFGHAMLDPQLCRNVHTESGRAKKKATKKTSGKSAALSKTSAASKTKTSSQKKTCTACVDACPIPDAVALLKGPVKIPAFAHHCTGCGLCVQDCPESAIRIEYA